MGEELPTTQTSDFSSRQKDLHKGMLAAVFCYVFWGLCPLFWMLLDEVDSFEIMAQRIIWCCVFSTVACMVLRIDFISLFKDRRALRYLTLSACLITLNWGLYVYTVSIDRIIETAVGYYINPLVSILLAVVFFKERLSLFEGIAVALCAFGVLFFTVSYGQFPVFAIVLAVTFGLYGAVKKQGGYPAIPSIAIESTIMLVPAIVFALVLASVTGSHAFLGDTGSAHGWYLSVLLILSGAVTGIPLILFAAAANSIPLVMVGYFQYISPTIALLLGVFVNGEPFTFAHGVCFGCLWVGLSLVTFDHVRAAKGRAR